MHHPASPTTDGFDAIWHVIRSMDVVLLQLLRKMKALSAPPALNLTAPRGEGRYVSRLATGSLNRR